MVNAKRKTVSKIASPSRPTGKALPLMDIEMEDPVIAAKKMKKPVAKPVKKPVAKPVITKAQRKKKLVESEEASEEEDASEELSEEEESEQEEEKVSKLMKKPAAAKAQKKMDVDASDEEASEAGSDDEEEEDEEESEEVKPKAKGKAKATAKKGAKAAKTQESNDASEDDEEEEEESEEVKPKAKGKAKGAAKKGAKGAKTQESNDGSEDDEEEEDEEASEEASEESAGEESEAEETPKKLTKAQEKKAAAKAKKELPESKCPPEDLADPASTQQMLQACNDYFLGNLSLKERRREEEKSTFPKESRISSAKERKQMNSHFLEVLRNHCKRQDPADKGGITPRDYQVDEKKFGIFLGVLSGKVPCPPGHIHNLLLEWVCGAGKTLMLSALMLFAVEADPGLSLMICACPNKSPRLHNIAKFRSMATGKRPLLFKTYGLGPVAGCEQLRGLKKWTQLLATVKDDRTNAFTFVFVNNQCLIPNDWIDILAKNPAPGIGLMVDEFHAMMGRCWGKLLRLSLWKFRLLGSASPPEMMVPMTAISQVSHVEVGGPEVLKFAVDAKLPPTTVSLVEKVNIVDDPSMNNIVVTIALGICCAVMLKDIKSMLCFNKEIKHRDQVFKFFERLINETDLRESFATSLTEFVTTPRRVCRVRGNFVSKSENASKSRLENLRPNKYLLRPADKVNSLLEGIRTGKHKFFCIDDKKIVLADGKKEDAATVFKNAVEKDEFSIMIAITCNMCTTGWDCQPLQSVFMTYIRSSVPWQVQVEGRIKRIYADKKECYQFVHGDFAGDFSQICSRSPSDPTRRVERPEESKPSEVVHLVKRMFGAPTGDSDCEDFTDEIDSGKREPVENRLDAEQVKENRLDAEQVKIFKQYDVEKIVQFSKKIGREFEDRYKKSMRVFFMTLARKRIDPAVQIEQTWASAYARDSHHSMLSPLRRWYELQIESGVVDQKAFDNAKKPAQQASSSSAGEQGVPSRVTRALRKL